jgi:hypothetical protein
LPETLPLDHAHLRQTLAQTALVGYDVSCGLVHMSEVGLVASSLVLLLELLEVYLRGRGHYPMHQTFVFSVDFGSLALLLVVETLA